MDTSGISGDELRARIDRLGMPYEEAARRLGLTRFGLYKQMAGKRQVSRQTEIILGYIEKERGPQARKRA